MVGNNVKSLFKRIAQALPGMEGEGGQGQSQSTYNLLTWAILSLGQGMMREEEC